MRLAKLLYTAAFVCGLLLPLGASAAGITNYPPLVNPSHWTEQNKSGDTVILDAKGVAAFNAKVRAASRSMPDLANYPAVMRSKRGLWIILFLTMTCICMATR